MEKNNQQRWKKRIAVVNKIYQDFISDHAEIDQLVKTCFEEDNFDHFQISIVESYVKNQQEFDNEIIKLLKPTWPYNRINPLTKAILQTALAEAKLKQVDKKIIIDQALKTCDHRGVVKDKKWINWVLDKLIENARE